MIGNVAVIAAEQLERSAGPAAALAAFRPLVVKLEEGEARERAIVGAVRCAARAGDAGALAEVLPYWPAVHGDRLPLVIELARALCAAGRPDLAAALAAEELDRQPGARAEYLLGRCLEAAGDAEAMEAYRRAAERAEREDGAEDVAFRARVRRLARLCAAPERFAEAVAEVAWIRDDPSAAPAEKLVIARARLGSASRFVRASALSALEECARTGGKEVAARAIELAAEHADAMGEALSPVELDRLAAVLRHARDTGERERALGRLAALARVVGATADDARAAALGAAIEVAPENERLLQRARALDAGRREGADLRAGRSEGRGADPESIASRLAAIGLDAIAALQGQKPLAAESALSRAADLVRPGGPAPAPVWTAARLALATGRRGVEAAALRLVDALLGVVRGRPPRGFADLGHALSRRGHRALAVRAFRAALAAKEPGAAIELGRARLAEGWALAERGEREEAARALREAKEALAGAKGER